MTEGSVTGDPIETSHGHGLQPSSDGLQRNGDMAHDVVLFCLKGNLNYYEVVPGRNRRYPF